MYRKNIIVLAVVYFITSSLYAQVQVEKNYSSDELLITFNSGVNLNDRNEILSKYGMKIVKSYTILPNTFLVRKSTMKTKQLAISKNQIEETRNLKIQIEKEQRIVRTGFNYQVHAINMPNDPGFEGLYGMNNTGQTGGTVDADIDAVEAWDFATGNHRVIVGIIDTGIDYDHPDLIDNMWVNPNEIAGNGIDDDHNGYVDDIYGWDWAYDDNDPSDYAGHGTHVAGTIGAVGNNGVGVTGVSWSVKLAALKFLDDYGYGYTDGAISALEYAAQMGITLTNNSWGGGEYSEDLKTAIENFDGLFIAAAGNSGEDNDIYPEYPASYDCENIIAVAATDHSDQRAYFSSYGATTVDLGAPGVNILSTKPDNPTDILFGPPGYDLDPNYYGVISGTSMATPHVSGAVALLHSYNPAVSWEEVKQAILDNVDPVSSMNGITVTGGRLNVGKAIQAINTGLIVEPDSLNFGITGIGEVKSLQLKMINATGNDVNINISSDNSLFYPEEASVFIETGQIEYVDVFFEPQEVSSVQGILSFDTGDTLVTVPVQGEGRELPIINVSLQKMLFDLSSADSMNQTLTIYNDGRKDLQWYINGRLDNNIANNNISEYPLSYYQPLLKGMPDNRVGHTVNSFSGGPDIYGYTWIDSDQKDGLKFNWIDISDSGKVLSGLADDNFSTPLAIGFNFPFYGNQYNKLYIASNGFIGFGPDKAYDNPNNAPLPMDNAPNNILAWLWDDLISSGSTVYYLTTHNRFIIQFENYGEFGASGKVTAQVILDANGTITFQYLNFENGFDVLHSSVGIENQDGSDGLEVVFNNTYLHDSLAVQFGTSQWLSVSPQNGNINPGEQQDITVKVNTKGMNAGTYMTYLDLLSNDIDKSPLSIPVTMTVDAQKATFTVDMSIYKDAGYFNTDAGDNIYVSGTFNNWATEPDNMMSLLDNNVYQAEIPLYGENGDTIPYKFYISAGDGRVLPNEGWEDAVGSYEGNRSVVLNGLDQILPTVYFNNNDSGFAHINISKDSLAFKLFEGDSTTDILNVENSGYSGLDIIISTGVKSAIQSLNSRFTEIVKKQDLELNDVQSIDGKDPVFEIPEYVALAGKINVSGKGNIAILGADRSSDEIVLKDIKQYLEDSGEFQTVTIINGGLITPSLEELQVFDAVGVFGYYGWYDDNAIGNVLADFVDSGGKVFIANAANCIGGPWQIGGRFNKENYWLMQPYDYNGGTQFNMGTIRNPGHSIMKDIETVVSGSKLNPGVSVNEDAEILADFTDSTPLIAICQESGRRQVDISFPMFTTKVSSWGIFESSDAPDLIINAFNWLVYGKRDFWLFADQDTVSIPAGSLLPVNLKINARNLTFGEYNAFINILSNDPHNPTMSIPVKLEVEMKNPPVLSVEPDSFYFDLVEGDSTLSVLKIGNEDGLSNLEWNLDVSFKDDSPSEADKTIPAYPASYYQPVEKGAVDNRIGNPVINNYGGPDIFGYRWIDSDESNGPEFEWVEIHSIGTRLYLYDDDNSGLLDLGFDFSFYGETYSRIAICSNGWLSFTNMSSSSWNSPLPSTMAPENVIALWAADLYSGSGSLYYYRDTENNRFIVEFENWGTCCNSQIYLSMQAIINQDGTIKIQYQNVQQSITYGTIGIQNADRTDGLTIAFNTSYIKDSLAVLVRKNLPWISVNPAEGVITPGDANEAKLKVNTSLLKFGHYYANLKLSSNDPLSLEKNIPVHLRLTVPDPPIMNLSADSITMSLLQGDTASQTITITNGGIGDLKWNANIESLSGSTNKTMVTSGNKELNSKVKISENNQFLLEPDLKESASVPVRILVWNKWTPSNYLSNTINAIRQYVDNFTYTTTTSTDSSVIRTNLTGQDVFIIPYQAGGSSSDYIQLGNEWKQVLYDFTDRGGVVILCGSNYYSSYIFSYSGLMEVNISSSYSSGLMDVIDKEHFITEELPNTIPINSITYFYSYGNTVRSLVEKNNITSVAVSNDNKAVLIGYNFYSYDQYAAKIISNAVMLGSQAKWMSINPTFGSVPGSESQDLFISFNSQDINPGNYNANLILNTNDPDKIRTEIPVQLEVKPPLPAHIEFSPKVLSTNILNGDSSLQTIHISNSGPGTLHWNLSISDDSTVADNSRFSDLYNKYKNDAGGFKDSYKNNSGEPTVSSIPYEALVSMSGGIKILSYIQYADMDGEYLNTLSAISVYFDNYTISETNASTNSDLASDLAGKDVFLIPEQENGSALFFYNLGVAFKSALHDFVSNGGSIILCGSTYGAENILVGADLLDINLASTYVSGILYVNNKDHFLTSNVPASFSATNMTCTYTINDSDAQSIISYSNNYPTVIYKKFGIGQISVLGFDYYQYNEFTARVIANAVENSVSGISISPISGHIKAGASQDVLVSVNSAFMDVGKLNKFLILESNDSLITQSVIPLNIEIIQNDGGQISIPDSLNIDVIQTEIGSDWFPIKNLSSLNNLNYKIKIKADTSIANNLDFNKGLLKIPGKTIHRPKIQNTKQEISKTNKSTIIAADSNKFEWVEVIPDSGSIALDDSQNVQLIIDAGKLELQKYRFILRIESNDYYNPVADMPVTINVQEFVPPRIRILRDSVNVYSQQNEILNEELLIHNDGPGPLKIQLSWINTTGDSGLNVDAAIKSVIMESGILSNPISVKCESNQGESKITQIISDPHDIAYTIHNSASGTKYNIAVLSGAGFDEFTDVINKINGVNKFRSVSHINVLATTPDLNQLKAFDGIFLWNSIGYFNSEILGNVLADYVDQGGAVVTSLLQVTGEAQLAGRWYTDGYNIIDFSVAASGQSGLGEKVNTNHPILRNITSFGGGSQSYRPISDKLTQGSEMIARWSDGSALVAEKMISGTQRVDLGFFPPSSDVNQDYWQKSTDGALLMVNAIEYAIDGGWITISPENSIVEADSTLHIALKVNTKDLNEGDYSGNIIIKHNDPDTSVIAIPVKLLYDPVTGIVETIPDIPNKFALNQNFPNPFNPSTIISYNIARTTFVELKIYDMLGREVKVLVSKKQNPGYYKQEFKADDLASGIYFYYLKAGNFKSVKKMILIR